MAVDPITPFDAVVIGAGPAGLTAATYLARFRRKVTVLDGGPPRAEWIPETHNTPGFPHGISGKALLRRLRDQACAYGVQTREATCLDVAKADIGFALTLDDGSIGARTILLATGVKDVIPPIAGIDDAIGRSLVRMCPICDAFEAIDKPIAVLGGGKVAARERAFLETYSHDVMVLCPEGEDPPPCTHENVRMIDIRFVGDKIEVSTEAGRAYAFDHLYLSLGCAAQTQAVLSCGASTDETGNLWVDARQMTSVAGMYAAGDVVRGLNQIAVATGEAAIAATAIHNFLREGG